MDQSLHLRGYDGSDAPPEDLPHSYSYVGLAESTGFESIEVPANGGFSSALQWAVTAGERYSRLRLRVSGSLAAMLESLRGREVFEASDALNGRLIVHMRAPDEDDLHSAGFAAAQEFLANLHRESATSGKLRLEIEGDSSMAAYLAIKWADCLWRTPHQPERVFADALPVLHFGKDVGLCLRVVAEETRQMALDAASIHMENSGHSDNWLTDAVWRNTEAESSGSALMIGSFKDVAAALLGYRDAGISQVMISGLNGIDSLSRFAAGLLPLIRATKSELQAR
jgi:hypothetical protein